MTDTYRVVAPYVMVKVRTPNGVEVKGLYASAVLPEGTLPESIEQHLKKVFQGRPMIEKIGGSPEPAAKPEPVEPPVAPPAPDPAPDPVAQALGADGGRPVAPPTTGPGSGLKAWADYAVDLGYDRGDISKMSRDELVALAAEEKPSG